MRSRKFLTICVVMLFLVSISGNSGSNQVIGQRESNSIPLILMTDAGNWVWVSYALYIQATLVPLGFDVKIHAKPIGQFVGNLLHQSTGQPFDMAITKFIGGDKVPNFMWKYHSTKTRYGQSIYQLNNPEWQNFMEADIEISTQEVDELLESIEYEQDYLKRRNKTNQFAKLYMDKLLYDLPLTVETIRFATWKGFGGYNNEMLDMILGIWGSRALGASWEFNPIKRVENKVDNETLQLRTTNPGLPGNFDIYQISDFGSFTQSKYMIETLLSFDSSFTPHPGIAYQWINDDVIFDHDTDPKTPDMWVENGRHTFLINNNFTFSNTTDIDGNKIEDHIVDANDFALALEILTHNATTVSERFNFDHLNKGYQETKPTNLMTPRSNLGDQIVKWEVKTTINPNDTLQVYFDQSLPDDYTKLGALSPIPDHLLGNELTWIDPDIQEQHMISVESNQSINPHNTIEWDHYESLEGFTHVGPMILDEYKLKENGYWKFKARSDYPFPNEMDVVKMADKYPSEFANFNSSINQINGTWTGNVSTFAPHTGVIPEPYFWDFIDNRDTDTYEKPKSQLITKLILKAIPNKHEAFVEFENGALDIIEFPVEKMTRRTCHGSCYPDYTIFETYDLTGGSTLLVFNLLNKHLRQRDVRYAIAAALDQEEMAEINNGLSHPIRSPVWGIYELYKPHVFIGTGDEGDDLSWYSSYAIEYNYELARDLMQSSGYHPQNTPNQDIVNTYQMNVTVTKYNVNSFNSWLVLPLTLFVVQAIVRRCREKTITIY